MSRTVSAGLTAHLATRAHKRATLLRLDLVDGTSIGVTDHDQDITYAGVGASLVYGASTGIFPSDLTLSVGLEADNYEITGPIGAIVTRPALLGGRFNRARARLFMVNWSDLTQGHLSLMAGNVSEARPEGGRFILQIRSDADRFNQVIGRLITPYCDADFGDARCTAVPEEVVGTVTVGTSTLQFTVSFTGTFADDFFNLGTVEALTGDLSGTLPVEIFDWTAAGVITLFTPLASVPDIGDTFTIKQGCGKTRADCIAFDNIENFRGFPEVPGSDQVLRMPVPGT